MPLGVREVILVIRAQNMASGVMSSIAGDFRNLGTAERAAAQQAVQTGSAMMAIGASIAAVGAAGLVFLGKAASAAVDYNKQVSLTRTQMYGVKASFNDVAQAGLDTASKIAVPLDQMQQGLYDIFSSMDVNMSQAKYLLTNFSKEAVAGQVDLSVAEKATIGILNAYQMKVQDVNKVQDIMFNMVKYGVGTYQDFADSIGRVTGPAVRANQTFDQTAALMAFTTRNGLSASNAASSVGRALDAIGKSRDKIKDFGQIVVGTLGDKTAAKLGITTKSMIQMTDAAGRLLPINQIMTELGSALKGLNPTQLNDVLTEMFKGTGGTIQAMRFIDIAVKNFKQLNTITSEMGQSKGALQAAYNIMAKTPAAQVQLLKNNFHILMIEIGNLLLPVVNKLVTWLTKLFQWLEKLPKSTLKWAAIILSVISVLAVLTGIILTVAGAWLVFSTIIEASEVAFLPLIGTIGLIVAAIAAVAVAGYFIYKNWDPISKWFHDIWFDMWHWVHDTSMMIWNWLQNIWGVITGWLTKTWDDIAGNAAHIWDDIWKAVKGAGGDVVGFFSHMWGDVEKTFDGFTSWISTGFDKWWATHGEALKQIWHAVWTSMVDVLKPIWNAIVLILKDDWKVLETVFKWGWNLLSEATRIGMNFIADEFSGFMQIISAIFIALWNGLVIIAKTTWNEIVDVVKAAWDIVAGVLKVGFSVLEAAWQIFWDVLKGIVSIFWDGLVAFVKVSWDTIVFIFSEFLDIVTGHWHTAWQDLLNFFVQIWNAIRTAGSQIWNATFNMLKGILDAFKNLFVGAWGSIESAAVSTWHAISKFLTDTWDGLVAGIKNTVTALGRAWSGIETAFKAPVNFVIQYVYDDGIRFLWNAVTSAIGLGGLGLPFVNTFASGGRVPGFGGGDIIPALLEPGEAIIDKHKTKQYAALFRMMGVPGFAGGGFVGGTIDVGKMILAAATGNSVAFVNALTSIAGGSSAGGSLGTILTTMPRLLATDVVNMMWNSLSGAAVKFEANPANALFSLVAGFFDEGGYLPPGLSLAYNGTGKPEYIPNPNNGSGATQNFYITTQEIDPRRHAAELGFELARRSG